MPASTRSINRWWLAAAGVLMQLALGAVYAWSVFREPLAKGFGWTISQVTLTFSITIFVLGFAAFAGGLWMARVGPRRVGVTAGIVYGVGVALASLSGGRLWWLYVSYGLLGGIGLGLGYIVPVATLIKWFPDKRGMITGLAVAGFGAGALVTAPIATALIDRVGVLATFAILGGSYLVIVTAGALVMRNPPEGYRPPGWDPSGARSQEGAGVNFALGDALRGWRWYGLWAVLFLNVSAGISLISQASPMAQEVTGVSAIAGAGLVGIISIANGAGRLFWAWLSDFIGRRQVFVTMFLLQAAIFFVLPLIDSFLIFTLLAFVVLLCYGGGFGTMPAFTADYFGARNVGSIYGLMLTAWSLGGRLRTPAHLDGSRVDRPVRERPLHPRRRPPPQHGAAAGAAAPDGAKGLQGTARGVVCNARRGRECANVPALGTANAGVGDGQRQDERGAPCSTQ